MKVPSSSCDARLELNLFGSLTLFDNFAEKEGVLPKSAHGSSRLSIVSTEPCHLRLIFFSSSPSSSHDPSALLMSCSVCSTWMAGYWKEVNGKVTGSQGELQGIHDHLVCGGRCSGGSSGNYVSCACMWACKSRRAKQPSFNLPLDFAVSPQQQSCSLWLSMISGVGFFPMYSSGSMLWDSGLT